MLTHSSRLRTYRARVRHQVGYLNKYFPVGHSLPPRSHGSFRAVMKLLKADFSEEELKTLERRFAAPRGANAGAMAYRRGSKAGGEAGVRFVELLHWGTPRRLSREGNEEVRSYVRRF